MKKIIFILILITVSLCRTDTAFASADAPVLPSGLTTTELESTIDAYVAEHEATTAAMSVAVFSGEEVLFEKAYGCMDLENKLVNDDNSVFEWGSCTKLLTWTSVMQLVEEGKLDLNEDIKTYLPKNFFRKLKYQEPITLLNLMNHNAGWQESITDIFIEDISDVKKLGDALRYLEPEQVAAPGERMAYSNWGSALAGYIVELVSGEAFDDYVRTHIFQPLGMEHTAISPDLSDNAWVAERRSNEKCYTTTNVSLDTCQYHIALYPAGMATGTISDFVKFAQALSLSNDGSTPLFKKAETLKEMLSPTAYYGDGITARNCHGFWTDHYSIPVLWHNGGTAGSTSWFTFDPVSGIGVIILTNQSGEYTYTCGILPMIFGKYQYEATTDTQDISGLYVSSRTDFTGYGKLFKLFCMTQINAGDNGFLSPTSGKTYTGIGKNSFIMDMGGAKQFFLYSATDAKGRKVLQVPSEDSLEVNAVSLLGEVILLLMFAVAFVYSLIALIIRLVRMASRKKKLTHPGYLSATNGSVILTFLLSVYMAVQLFSPGAMLHSIRWVLVVNGLCALLPIAYTIYLVLSLHKLNSPGKTKAGLIINACMSLIMTANVLYWNIYKFW